MRRMITTKQQEFIEHLDQVVEPVALYPQVIEGKSDYVDWEFIQSEVGQGKVNFEEHKIASGFSIEFRFAKVLEEYGVGETEVDPGYVTFLLGADLEFPESINNFDKLQQYMNSEAFADALNEASLTVDDYLFSNDVNTYMVNENEYSFDIENGSLVLNVELTSRGGVNEPVIGAVHPQYNAVKINGGDIQASKLSINNDGIQFNGIKFFADTIKSMKVVNGGEGESTFEIPVDVTYLVMGTDLKDPTYETGFVAPSGVAFYGRVEFFQQKDAFNTAAPVSLLLKPMTVGANREVYAFTGTQLIIGKNVYKWNSDDERYTLQGTFQTVAPAWLEFALILPGNRVECYNA